MTVLEKIIAAKRREVAELKKTGLDDLRSKFAGINRGARRSLKKALAALSLESSRPRIIAEIKKASPSAGLLRADFAPLKLADEYQQGGAAALSVVTDKQFFQGSLDWLVPIRAQVTLPLLRKDFIVDPLQIEESYLAGADAILLIASVLSKSELADFQALAASCDLECLVEVRDVEDAEKISAVGAPLIGINNRDLGDFTINLNTSIDLVSHLPEESLIVSESGIEKAADIKKLQHAGINAFLIGTSLVKAGGHRQALLRELMA